MLVTQDRLTGPELDKALHRAPAPVVLDLPDRLGGYAAWAGTVPQPVR